MEFAQAFAELTDDGGPFAMDDVTIDGRRVRAWRAAATSLREILVSSREFGDREFLVFDAAAGGLATSELDRLDYATHFRLVSVLANRLRNDLGVAKGDRVAIAMRNRPEWSIAFWAITSIGAIVVPLNAWLPGEELAFGIEDSGSRFVICDGDRARALGPSRGGCPSLEATIVVDRDNGEPIGDIAFNDLIASTENSELPDVDIEPDDDATIFYTSGTTGRPKGALGTHRNICTNLVSLQYSFALAHLRGGGSLDDDPGDPSVYLLAVPFFHVTGCHSVLVSNMAMGNKIVVMYRWNADRALELIEGERVTGFGGVPTIAWQVLEHPDRGRYDLSSLTSVSYGGAPAAPELLTRIHRELPGATASNGYGLTETSSLTSMNLGVDYDAHPDSAGRPVAVCDVAVLDGDGRVLATGELGELAVRGPNIVRGYWNRPDATASAIQDGWLHTGDVAYLDEDNFIFIVDRAKDMIIRGGENIHCIEVESRLFEMPDIVDAAAIGIPDRVLGEQVGAVVQVRAGGSLTESDVIEFAAAGLAHFKVPIRVWFTAEPLPRNPNGKVVKRDLRARYTG